jgi:predicted nucleotidyltransferase
MATSIDNYLRNLSASYYLKNDSIEVEKINKSISAMFDNLDKELSSKFKRRFIFGSYDRDTILPRSIDVKSDVDIMVVFNHTEYERTPGTYRNWLKDFADKYYKDRYDSEVVKSAPTVTIRLNHINYDLVPAKETTYVYSASDIYIPDGDYDWRKTDPNDVKTKLTDANTKYNGIVRPIIRLMKAWNSTNGYPFDSYLLETEITGMNFYNDNCQSGFFWAVDHLENSGTQYKKDKLESLRYNIGYVKTYLQSDDLEKAKQWLHRVIPN